MQSITTSSALHGQLRLITRQPAPHTIQALYVVRMCNINVATHWPMAARLSNSRQSDTCGRRRLAASRTSGTKRRPPPPPPLIYRPSLRLIRSCSQVSGNISPPSAVNFRTCVSAASLVCCPRRFAQSAEPRKGEEKQTKKSAVPLGVAFKTEQSRTTSHLRFRSSHNVHTDCLLSHCVSGRRSGLFSLIREKQCSPRVCVRSRNLSDRRYGHVASGADCA